MIFLGGKKGLGALAGLVFTLCTIWFILIPGLIRGGAAIPLTVVITAVTAVASLILLNGYSQKTFCAVLGCVGGVLVAGVAAAIVGSITPMNGFNMQEAENLILYGADKGLKVSGPFGVRRSDLRSGGGDGCGAGNRLLHVGSKSTESCAESERSCSGPACRWGGTPWGRWPIP